MLDIHTHLFWKSYDADRDAVIARAREVGVTKMICVGTEPKDNPQVLAMAERYEDVYASVGLHPHYFNQLATNREQLTVEIEELRKFADDKKVVAIGECGLDYYVREDRTTAQTADAPLKSGTTVVYERKTITEEQKKFQREGFLAQLELAQELDLPVIVHTRPSVGSMDAYEDVFGILCDTKYVIPHTILHCYQGDTEITKKFLELPNVYFSFAGNITYPVKKAPIGTKPARSRYSVSGGDDLPETVKLVPLERLFVETDCPFLAPQSKRGQRNEPAFVMETAEKIAFFKGIEGALLEKTTVENASRVFMI